VCQLLLPVVELFFCLRLGQLPVEIEPLHVVGDIFSLQKGGVVEVDLCFGMIRLEGFQIEEVAELILLELPDRIVQYLGVECEPDLVYETALFGPQNVSRSPDIKIPHGDVESG